MIGRPHGIALALLLGAASVTGAYATITTGHLGDSETKPEVVASAAIAKRHARLDAWEASLNKALAARPPKLPPVPRYARASLVSAPSFGPLPALTAAPAPAGAPARAEPAAPRTEAQPAGTAATRPKPGRGKAPRLQPAPTATRTDPGDSMPVAAPATDATPAPAAAAPAAPPAAAPAAPVPPAATPPAQPAPLQLSKSEIERQCEALKQAAERQGDAAKREAERQCEALKNAAERRG